MRTLDTDTQRRLRAAGERQRAATVEFCQRLIRQPSMPGEEGPLAELVRAEMGRLGYDDAWIDRGGNVVGVLRGAGGGRSLMLNTHLDHVGVGDPADWPHGPFAAEIVDDVLYGRGASDIKGALAPQVYAVALLKEAGLRPAGDLYVTSVVQEEIGGLGARILVEELRPGAAILGEATSNNIRRGHRGRVGMWAEFTGVAAHASAPARGANPHYALARFLTAIEGLPMRPDETFGGSTVAPTVLRSNNESTNVIPDGVRLFLDWRNVPSESPEEIEATVRALLDGALIERVGGQIRREERTTRTYTGVEESGVVHSPAYALPADHPLVVGARDVLADFYGRPVEVGTWGFATDGGWFMAAGIDTIGFSPCEEAYAHTIHDQIALPMLHDGLLGYAALSLALTAPEG
jgi:succinyl-diaminopimelate desuccinylase